MRGAFFDEANDVSNFDSLTDIVSGVGIDPSPIRQELATGQAAASLMADYEHAESLRLRGGPSFVLDCGR